VTSPENVQRSGGRSEERTLTEDVVNVAIICRSSVRRFRVHVEILSLKESAEERCRFIRDADDLIRCLTIEFEIELGLGSTVVPIGKGFQLAPSKATLGERGGSDGNAHARRLPGDPAFLCYRFGRGNDSACNETWPAFVLAREDEDRIAFGDVLATIHCLLCAERERLRQRIPNLGFDREHHTPYLTPLICGRPWGQV
jgi:hypothetical protein